MDKIVVLDFGSQYSHLICRRIRDFSVYAELVPYDISLDELKKLEPKGIIFSGGPSSVYNSDAPFPENTIFGINGPLQLCDVDHGHYCAVRFNVTRGIVKPCPLNAQARSFYELSILFDKASRFDHERQFVAPQGFESIDENVMPIHNTPARSS